MISNDPEDLCALAGEFVLGTLDAAQADEVRRELSANTVLRREIVAWEERLHPLSAMAGESEPPRSVWAQIAARVSAPREPAWRRVWTSAPLWRTTALGAVALACLLAIYIAVSPTAVLPLVAVLHPAADTTPSWIATIAGRHLDVRPIANAVLPPDHDFQLWVIAPGQKVPHALGVLPAGGRFARTALPPEVTAGAVLAISIEPRGGSPSGLPTGPVVFEGTISS